MLELTDGIVGHILDIGGGDEGVISSIYGNIVTAVDCDRAELEIPYACSKVVMDASVLDFPDLSFQNVTAFYAFLFIEKVKHEPVIREAFRVLQPGGSFYLWDTVIGKHAPLPFMKDLVINANGKRKTTTYGIVKSNPEQNAAYFEALCHAAGFHLVTGRQSGMDFYQHWEKPCR